MVENQVNWADKVGEPRQAIVAITTAKQASPTGSSVRAIPGLVKHSTVRAVLHYPHNSLSHMLTRCDWF